MFEKFTERARKVMSLARQQAQRLNSEFIGSEHVLLGILEEGGGVAAKVLKKFSIDSKTVKAEIEKLITPSNEPTKTLGQLPFSPRAKRVIELAGEASSRLGIDVIGTGQLLIGLIRENEGIAAQVMKNIGLDMAKLEKYVEQLEHETHFAAVSIGDPRFSKIVIRLYEKSGVDFEKGPVLFIKGEAYVEMGTIGLTGIDPAKIDSVAKAVALEHKAQVYVVEKSREVLEVTTEVPRKGPITDD